ncbi:helix-hairpin-helix domain-containing protein [Archaeoglobus veneficus]|uniref:Radical SAM domain protein n=1 Tax=Archaeoglobus veneficus (strain DSM 11195 / SNP6) TaxID=693661 RepID=F2KPI9_ARCVS|nr:helix-hairpin-helix domain-containing protein [Archaeoglobus veneficus]AEA46420.1 Radical SAM domain protein [Archaeoglobus veneficus SNP6]
MAIAIVDGYVDEPSCLGVPPYISPYPRYIYGMLRRLKINAAYFTAEQVRERPSLLEKFDFSIVIAGAIVPGKYLAAKPLSLREVAMLPGDKVVVGPVALELGKREKEELNVLNYPFERELFEYLCKYSGVEKSFDLDSFAILGSEVVRQHPDFPHVICEIETYRGCYWRKCSFCMEFIHGRPKMRDPNAVLGEIEALYSAGVRHFRLGRQTDFFTYMADFSYEVPKPNADFMLAFHREIWRRCPKIKTLHLDNVNPKTIAEHPEESSKIIKTIVMYQTPGNVAAFGLESADERVVELNSLAAMPDEVMKAIELVNCYGRAVGYNGMPCFLPGINFVIGLIGETKKTFEKNFEFLSELLERNLLVRRINIRQVKIVPGTKMEKFGDRNVRRHKKYFRFFKRKVREEIDREMLRKLVPVGRKLTELRCEVVEGNLTFARQMGTYPLLVGLVGRYTRNKFVDARVVGYGMRSVTAVEILDVNRASLQQLEAIPGIGKATAAKIVANRPFRNVEEIASLVENFDEIKDFFLL